MSRICDCCSSWHPQRCACDRRGPVHACTLAHLELDLCVIQKEYNVYPWSILPDCLRYLWTDWWAVICTSDTSRTLPYCPSALPTLTRKGLLKNGNPQASSTGRMQSPRQTGKRLHASKAQPHRHWRVTPTKEHESRHSFVRAANTLL